MKKTAVIFLLGLFICLGFVACQKSEPTEQVKNYPVTGIWHVITLSIGKQFIIIDDEFNDIWPSPKLTLHFTKETEKTGE